MTLRVKLEIIPCGNEENAYEIGRLNIFNKGKLELGHSAYGVLDLGKEPGLFTNEIKHRRDRGAWALLRKAIEVLEIEGP